MAFNFPDSPTPGQVFQQWTWNGIAWVLTAPSNYTKAEADAKFVDVSGDTMTGHLTLPTTPAAANAVRKDYVDAAVAGTVSKTYVDTQDAAVNANANTKLPIAGGTITGALTVNSELVAATSYIRMGTSGTGGYFQWGGGASYNCGGNTIYHSGNFNPASYLPLSGGTLSGQLNTPESQNITYGGSAGTIEVGGNTGNGGWAVMTFHVHGAFAFNFGANQNGHLYYGGWSHGGNYYQLWSSQDFGAPNFAPYVSNGRLAFAADTATQLNGPITEPYGGSVLTGLGYSAGAGSIALRFRYMQLLTTGWFTIGYA